MIVNPGMNAQSGVTMEQVNAAVRDAMTENEPGFLTEHQNISGKLDKSGGTITGNLTLKGSGNYGNKINFGDGDYVHLSEPVDDCLEIKAKKINFITSDTTEQGFTLNEKPIQNGADIKQQSCSAVMASNSSATGTIDRNSVEYVAYGKMVLLCVRVSVTISGDVNSMSICFDLPNALIPLKTVSGGCFWTVDGKSGAEACTFYLDKNNNSNGAKLSFSKQGSFNIGNRYHLDLIIPYISE